MDKRTFLDGLRTALVSLPASEIDKTVAYYEEMIDDRIEEGMSEEEAVASMEPIGVLAQMCIRDSRSIDQSSGSHDRHWADHFCAHFLGEDHSKHGADGCQGGHQNRA